MDQHRRSECAVSVRLPWRVFVCVLAMSAGCGQGSGSSGTGGSPGSGGATSSGGSPGSGGTSSSGGTTGSGGITASGGATGSGGATSTGGATGSGGSKASGGATGSGGATSAGGTTGSGGATSSGGVTGSGGATASGGNSGSGGVAGSGGKAGSGGATSTGGTTGTGGASGTGGAAGAPDTTGALGSQAAVPSAGCGTTSTLTFGKDPNETGGACTKYPGGNCSGSQPGYGAGGWLTIKSSDSANGRGFDVRLPDNYDNTKPYPLYFGFHWRGGTANQVDNGGSNGYWWSYYGIQRKSNNGFIFVAPQGIGNGWSDASDLTFVDDMVSLIEKNYCVDTTRLVSSGFSFGAGMSYALACARAKVFHAVVLYEGGVISGCNNPATDPIAFMQIEGLTDTTLSISGAYPMRDKFVTNNGCSPLASSLDKPGSMAEPPNPPPYLSSGGHICTNYSGCSAGHPLRWCVSQSGHGPGPIDGTSDLYNSCATSPGCSASCPCTWTPDDVWSWLTTSEAAGTSFQTPNATK